MARREKKKAKPSPEKPKQKPAPDNSNFLFAEFGRRLREARAIAGVTRNQLAAYSGASLRYLAHLEAGTGNPSLSIMESLAAALDVAIPDLLARGGERDAQQGELIGTVRRLSKERRDALTHWLSGPNGANESKARRITLIGLRGAGKTSLGEELAQRLGVPFFELSKEVERAYGGPIGLLIELGGQAALRRFEEEAWQNIVQENSDAVIAASGGIVAEGALFDKLLDTSHVVWLKASPEDHMTRVMAQGDFRPMSANRTAMADLKAILDARSREYSRADVTLNTSDSKFEATLNKLETVVRDLVPYPRRDL